MELPFVFDALDDPNTAAMLGGVAPMHAAWVRFAKTGDPGWPRYSTAERARMRFDTSSQLTVDDRADERALWPRRRSN